VSFLNQIKKNNFLLLHLFIVACIDIYLQFIPLTKIFSFEYSFVNAILLCFLSGIYFIAAYRKADDNFDRAFFKQRILLSYFFFLLLPALISIANSFFTIQCPLTDGLSFYLVITFPAVIVGASLGIISVSIFRRFSFLIFVILFLAVLSIPLFEFYFNPQIYFYNPVFGFYPGTIYDEGLGVNLHLIIYRILNLIYFGAVFFILYKRKILLHNLKKKLFFAAVLLTAVLFNYFSPAIGYSTTFSKLNDELNNKVETSHFIIHFPRHINRSMLKALCLTHEYYYTELSKFFGYEMNAKINSYIFYDNAQKKELIGTANADIAKPWLNCSFITLNSYEETLRHELAHCFSSKMGTGIFKVASGLNPALIEGIAVSADPFYDEHSIDFMAALAYKEGYKTNIENLFGGFSFYSNSSSVSYIYAGSFTKFLIQKYGIGKFKKYYSSNNFEASFGITFQNVEKKYYNFIDTLNYEFNPNEANYYYGYKSIFYKICPRYAAAQLEKAWQLYNDNEYTSADKIFTAINNLTENYPSLIGHAECLLKESKINGAINLLKSKIENFKKTSYYFNVELKLADSYFIYGETEKADSIYENIVRQNPTEALINLANLRLSLSGNKDILKIYLTGNDYDRFLLLKRLNEARYDYYSIPAMINLAKYFNIDYRIMSEVFTKPPETNNFSEIYAMYKISNYMFENLDFRNALKYASLSVHNNRDKDYDLIFKENYNKINWCNSNSSYIFASAKYNGHF